MSWGNYHDGEVCFTYCEGLLYLSADDNEMQRQLTLIFGPRSGSPIDLSKGLGTSGWVFHSETNPTYWEAASVSAAETLVISVNLAYLWNLTKIDTWTMGSAAGGELKILERTLDTVPDTWNGLDLVANPWNNAGAILKKTLSGGSLPWQMATLTELSLRYITPTTGTYRVYGAMMDFEYNA